VGVAGMVVVMRGDDGGSSGGDGVWRCWWWAAWLPDTMQWPKGAVARL